MRARWGEGEEVAVVRDEVERLAQLRVRADAVEVSLDGQRFVQARAVLHVQAGREVLLEAELEVGGSVALLEGEA